jgi:hypothetical protein
MGSSTLESFYLSHPMVRRLADIEQCQTQAENILEQLGLDNEKIKARYLVRY